MLPLRSVVSVLADTAGGVSDIIGTTTTAGVAGPALGLPARAAVALTCFPFRRALERLDAPGPGRMEDAAPPAAPAPALEDPALATFAAGGGREGPLEPAEVPRETAARAAAARPTCAAKRIPSL